MSDMAPEIQPTAGAAKAEGAARAEGAVPAEGAAPTEGAASTGGAASTDGAAAAPGASVAKIDFDRAEMEEGAAGGVSCSACQQAIHTEYWQLLDKILCDTCSAAVGRTAKDAAGAGTFARAFLYSGAIALGCGIGYAVFAGVTHIHFALITIGIGWVVGRAVQKVTRGFGSVKHQVLAVALTYAASSMGYLPPIVTALTGGAGRSEQTVAAASTAVAPGRAPAAEPAPAAAPASADAPPEKAGPGLGAALVLFALITTGLTLAAPLLEITSGFNGLLGALIIFFGLRMAWRVSRGVPAAMTGPHRIAPAAT